MLKALVFDSSKVLIIPFNNDADSLNTLYQETLNLGKQFADAFRLNTELLDFIKTVRGKAKTVVFTSGKFLQDAPEVGPVYNDAFDTVLGPNDIPEKKNDPEAFRKLLAILKLKAEQIAFIDDKAENIKAAESVGLHALQFMRTEETVSWLKQLLND